MRLEVERVGAVVFDAVGTLIRPRPAAAEVYWRAAQDYGSQLPLDEVRRRLTAALAAEHLEASRPTDETRERSFWRRVVCGVLDDVAEIDPLFEALWTHFASFEAWALYPDVEAAWRRLAASGLQLAIASNFDSRLHAICDALPPLDGCRHVCCASELGWRKPNPQFYAEVSRRLDLPPERLLFVGDELQADVLGPQAAGWQALHLARDAITLHHVVRLLTGSDFR